MTSPEAVAAALSGGAAYLGFVFFAASPRNIAPEAAARLAVPARRRAEIVAVTADPADELLDRLTAILDPDLIQLHGGEAPARARAIGERTGARVIKALPIADHADFASASDFEPVVAHLMFDARPPAGAGRPGGAGAAFEPGLLAGRRYARPWFLAGGLNPWNVTEAIAASGAPLVDVSSGVERGPGLKDPALIGAFLEAVRRA